MINKIQEIIYYTDQKEIYLRDNCSFGCVEDIENIEDLADIEYTITDQGQITTISVLNFDKLIEDIDIFELPNLGIFKYRNFEKVTLTQLITFVLKDFMGNREFITIRER